MMWDLEASGIEDHYKILLLPFVIKSFLFFSI